MKRISYLSYRTGKNTPIAVNQKRKYANRHVEIDGIRFDSRFEAKVWGDLKIAERLGEIVNLRRQVKFDLKVNNIKVCSIILDFAYTDVASGKDVYADAKSPATRANRAYRIKKKLFEALYGHEILEIVND